MRHADARIAKLEKTQAELDWLVDHQARLIEKLHAEKERAPGSYRIEASDIRQIALAIREIEAGDRYGLRRLEDLLEAIRPDWREWL
jgi:hypothetical protein